ncbi:MAG TPA: MBL fold metallo-hydrolase, partial [Gemmatimonadales bacterium]
MRHREYGDSTITALCIGTMGILGASPATAQSPREVVARAVAAMGGEQALRGVTASTMDFYTMTFGVGQEETPESPARATVAHGNLTTDWRGPRRVLSQEVRQLNGTVTRQRRVTAGGIGLVETDGRQAPDAPGAVAAAEGDLRRARERLYLAALDNPGALSPLPPKELRGDPSPGVRYARGPDTLDLYFDRRSGLPLALELITDDGILGDRHTVQWFTRWQGAGGIQLPRQVDVTVNGRLQSHTIYTSAGVNGALDEAAFAFPDSIRSRAQRPPASPPPVVAQLAELAPGLWRAEGGSHHSLVVEQAQELIVVEGPQTSRRSQVVLDTLRSRFPSKPVRLLVNTHHHWDHAGGVRGYLAAGVPVLTHARNAAFIRGIAATQKTVAPDALSRGTRPPEVRTVEDSVSVGSGNGRMVIYRIPTAHVEGLLGAYVPSARILFLSDVLTPGPTLPRASAAEVVAAVRRLGITVDRVVGGHGGIASWEQVEAAA